MSKKDNELSGALKNLMGEDQENKTSQKVIKQTEKQKEKKTSFVAIRIPIEDKKNLENYFKSKGIISFSIGVRKILYDFMQDNNLI